MLHTHIESHQGNGCFVTCARIMRDTWCANCRPHAHRNGMNSGDCRIVGSRNDGALSHASSSATEIGNGSKRTSGTKGFWWPAIRELKTLK